MDHVRHMHMYAHAIYHADSRLLRACRPLVLCRLGLRLKRAGGRDEEGDEEGEAAFWGALCDEWERSDTVEGRRVERFAFYLMQADTLDGEEDGGYGQVRKRLMKRFDCRLRK